jgi:hypothetical protein
MKSLRNAYSRRRLITLHKEYLRESETLKRQQLLHKQLLALRKVAARKTEATKTESLRTQERIKLRRITKSIIFAIVIPALIIYSQLVSGEAFGDVQHISPTPMLTIIKTFAFFAFFALIVALITELPAAAHSERFFIMAVLIIESIILVIALGIIAAFWNATEIAKNETMEVQEYWARVWEAAIGLLIILLVLNITTYYLGARNYSLYNKAGKYAHMAVYPIITFITGSIVGIEIVTGERGITGTIGISLLSFEIITRSVDLWDAFHEEIRN